MSQLLTIMDEKPFVNVPLRGIEKLVIIFQLFHDAI